MQVVLLTQSLRGGGAEQVCLNWAHALAAAGNEVTILAFRTNAPLATLDDLASRKIQVVSAPASAKSPLAKVAFVRRYLRNSDAVVLVSLLTFPNLVALVAALGTRCATVISEHNVPSVLLRRQGLSQRVQLQLARRLYRRASHVIAVSHAVAADLACNFGVRGDRGTVLPNAILSSGDDRSPQPAVGQVSAVELVIPARITPQKRPRFALRVAEELAGRGHDVRLRYIGDPSPAFPDPSVLTSSSVQVSVETWDSEWASNVPTGTILLLPSDVEGLGNVLVEAASASIKVVAGSWALGVSDAIVPGVTGVLARSDTPQSYADAIEEAQRMEDRPSIQSWLQIFGTRSVSAQLNAIVKTAAALGT